MAKVVPTVSLADVLHAPLNPDAWKEIESAAVVNVRGSTDVEHLFYAFRIFLKHAIPAAIEAHKAGRTGL